MSMLLVRCSLILGAGVLGPLLLDAPPNRPAPTCHVGDLSVITLHRPGPSAFEGFVAAEKSGPMIIRGTVAWALPVTLLHG